MFAHLGQNQFEIVVIANNKLLLYNSFTFETKEDFIYYILFAAEQLGLNPETFELVLAGSISKDVYLLMNVLKAHELTTHNNHSSTLATFDKGA